MGSSGVTGSGRAAFYAQRLPESESIQGRLMPELSHRDGEPYRWRSSAIQIDASATAQRRLLHNPGLVSYDPRTHTKVRLAPVWRGR
jgi:hypothetical protein